MTRSLPKDRILLTRALKILGVFFFVVFLFSGVVLGGIYVLSEQELRNVEAPPEFKAEIPSDASSIARGEHVARIRGCFGCHGQQLQGRVFTDRWPWVKRAVAPNLTKYAQEHTVAAMEAAIRRGIGHDGRAFWSMPSYNWVHLSDEDLISLIAFLRSAEITDKDLPRPAIGLRARWNIVTGADKHIAAWVDDVPPLKLQHSPDPRLREGEYLEPISKYPALLLFA